MGETLHKRGIGKILAQRYKKRITVTQGRTNFQKQPIHLKTSSSDIYTIPDYGFFPSRTSLKPQITIRKPIKSPVFSPTLLQIYCIGLIGLIIHLFWVWAEICYPTLIYSTQSQIDSAITLLIFGKNHIFVSIFSRESYFGPYFLFPTFLVPIQKNTLCFNPYCHLTNRKYLHGRWSALLTLRTPTCPLK